MVSHIPADRRGFAEPLRRAAGDRAERSKGRDASPISWSARLAFLTTAQRQELLETVDVAKRLELVNRYLIKERQLTELRTKIESEVQDQMAQGQREYYLREQLKAIQKELGERRRAAARSRS